jgi:hypothetical protein
MMDGILKLNEQRISCFELDTIRDNAIFFSMTDTVICFSIVKFPFLSRNIHVFSEYEV